MLNKAKILTSKIIFSSNWIEVREDNIKKPDGSKATHEIVKRRDCVLVLAFEDGKLLLTRQLRYPANEFLWEFPGGFINKDETPLKAAIRELEEESGCVSSKTDFLGSFWTWPGFSTQKTFVFLANNLTKGSKNLDKSESDLKTKFVPYKKILRLVKDGVIKSSTALAALTIFSQIEKS